MHITTGSPPLLRIDGQHRAAQARRRSAPVETKQLCYSVLTEEQSAQFEKTNELDLSFGVKGLSRFRANIFMQRGAVAGAFRTIPFKILTFEELGLPPIVAELAKKPSGLVLVTGPTGSGKSTTLAAIIDKINTEQRLPHHHDRGPDRVPAPAQALDRQPARGRAPTPRASRTRSSTSCGRTPTSCSSARCATSRRSRPR